MEQNKNLDLIGVLGCLFIVVLHTVPDGIKAFEPFSLLSGLPQIVVRTGFPMILMLCGYHFIREYRWSEIGEFYKKCFQRLVPLFLLYSYAYFVYEQETFNVLKFLSNVVHKEAEYHLWFIGCVFGIYLCTPFLSNIVVRAEKRMLVAFLLLSALLHSVVRADGSFMLPYPSMWLVYFLTGHVLRNIRHILPADAFGRIFLAVTAFLLLTEHIFWENGVAVRPYDNGFFILLQCSSLFLFLLNIRACSAAWIGVVSEFSYEIYLIHPFFIMQASSISGSVVVRLCLVMTYVIFFAYLRKYIINRKNLRRLSVGIAAFCLVLASTCSAAENVVVSFVGDCTLGGFRGQSPHGGLGETFVHRGAQWFFSGVADRFRDDDITFINLEGPFSSTAATADKKFPIWCPLPHADILKNASVEAVNLSNNHIYDCGEKGFQKTLAVLDGLNIGYAGEGHVWKKEVRGVRLAFFGFRGWNVTPQTVKKTLASTDADVKIVEFHWGEEYRYLHNASQAALARAAVDAGASFVVGAHPHVLQDVEFYRNVPVFYSLGNFVFGANKNPRDKDTALVRAEFSKQGFVRARVFPMRLSSSSDHNDYRPCPADEAGKKRVFYKLKGKGEFPDSIIFVN